MKTAAAVVLVAVSALMAPPGAAAMDGRLIYAQSCAQCHANGLAGAPRPGDKAAWIQRLALGRDAMLTTVLTGKGAMPRKGGNASLSDAEAKAAADHLLRQLR
jgi:cytochrome c5